MLTAPDAVVVTDGRPVDGAGPDQLWSFDVEADLSPSPETPGSLVIAGRSAVPVRVLAVGDGTIVLAASADLGPEVLTATLSISAGFVLSRLEERLQHLVLDGDADARLVDALLNPDSGMNPTGSVPFDDLEPDGAQRAAASNAVARGLAVHLGTPGTGKSRVVGLSVAEAALRGDQCSSSRTPTPRSTSPWHELPKNSTTMTSSPGTFSGSDLLTCRCSEAHPMALPRIPPGSASP